MSSESESVVDDGGTDAAQNQTTTRRDPRSLTSLSDILSCLSTLQSEEAELANSLTDLLNAREPIIQSLDRLNSLIPQIDELDREASLLSGRVSNTAKTAERVGGRVRLLDDEMGRVREAADRVGQVMELKVCVHPAFSNLLALLFFIPLVFSRRSAVVY